MVSISLSLKPSRIFFSSAFQIQCSFSKLQTPYYPTEHKSSLLLSVCAFIIQSLCVYLSSQPSIVLSFPWELLHPPLLQGQLFVRYTWDRSCSVCWPHRLFMQSVVFRKAEGKTFTVIANSSLGVFQATSVFSSIPNWKSPATVKMNMEERVPEQALLQNRESPHVKDESQGGAVPGCTGRMCWGLMCAVIQPKVNRIPWNPTGF